MQPNDLTHKFVAVLNKKIPVGNLMNALGHMTAGLAGSYPNKEEMRFDNYFDKDGAEVIFADFTSTMTVGTYIEQQEKTKQTPEAEFEYYGICFFGPKDVLNNLTRKFSLWR